MGRHTPGHRSGLVRLRRLGVGERGSVNPFRSLFERRSIGSSYDLWQSLMRGVSSVSGQEVTESTAMNVAAVYTGVAIRTRLLSTLPVDVIERLDGRTTREATSHPLTRVLWKPNSWQTRSELFGMVEAHRILRGNGYAWINWVMSPMTPEPIATELIPLHPDRVEVLQQPDGIGGVLTYKVHRANGQQPLTFAAAEILHLRNLSTNGYVGRSFIADMREVIGGSLATQEHANSLWSRDATPSIALSHPQTLSDKARKNLEDSWEATYGRGKDKKRIAVIEEGLQIKQLSLSPEDGQFLETQQDLRAQIAAALMVPPHLMGLADKATSWGTGIEQQTIGLLAITLRPDLTTWEERLTMDLIRAGADRFRVKFNVRGMLRGDLRSQFESFYRGILMGVYSPNDVRAMLDMNPIEAGDIYLQAANMIPLGSMDETTP